MRAIGRWALVATLSCLAATFAPAPAGAAPVAQPPGPMPVLPAPPGFPVPAAPAPGAPLPPALDWLTAAKTLGRAVTAKHGAIEQLVAARSILRRTQIRERAARSHLARVRRRIEAARGVIAKLRRARAIALARQRERAVRAYMDRDDAVLISDLMSAPSINDQARRAIYANAGQEVDARSIDRLDADLSVEGDVVTALQRTEQGGERSLAAAGDAVQKASANFRVLSAARTNAWKGGRVFPVEGAFEFDDSWGAFRADLAIDTHSHGHDATDIMAAGGTPVVAIESGTLDRVGWNELGGWRLWIKGVSGTNYYYAHMSAYGPNLMAGVRVVAGQYLGRVGNTGNAAGGPTHLHIEVHLPDARPDPSHPRLTSPPGPAVPGSDGRVVNPYPLLCLLAGAPIPVIPPSDPTPPPDPTPPSSTAPPNSRGT